MARFTDRLKSIFGAGASSVSPPAENDPLNYDDLIQLDAEDLAEQGILSAYEQLLPRLKQYTPSPLEVTEAIDSNAARYSVSAGGKEYRIWDDGAKNSDGWERATVAFFQIVNANLNSSTHRFYALYGGNDLSGIFLTEEEFAAARRGIVKPSNWPWLPVDEPPRYGYPA